MAKKTVIQDRVKIRGIRKRWLVNSMGVVTLILLLAMGTLTLSLWAYYEGSMRDNLSSRASDTARSFSVYTRREYRTAAQDYVAKFPDKQKLEVQFIETDGSLLCTSYGLTTSGTMPGTPDITGAMESGDVKPWTGQDPQTGERIMAVSAPIIYQGTTVGVIRFVTSMAAVDRQLFLSIGVCTLIGIAIFAMVYFSNLYFVRSIVEPLASITETARLIADGSYGVQIEKKFDDEIGELTDTINDMSLKIKQSEKTQSEFISSVSHELRTPLTAINGWAETIQSGELKDPEDVRKGMDIIVSEARRLTNMVEELLEFSRIEDGRFTLSVEPLDLKAELEDAVYTYREFFRREGIELTYHGLPGGDAPHLRRPGAAAPGVLQSAGQRRQARRLGQAHRRVHRPGGGGGGHPHPGLRPRHPGGGAALHENTSSIRAAPRPGAPASAWRCARRSSPATRAPWTSATRRAAAVW